MHLLSGRDPEYKPVLVFRASCCPLHLKNVQTVTSNGETLFREVAMSRGFYQQQLFVEGLQCQEVIRYCVKNYLKDIFFSLLFDLYLLCFTDVRSSIVGWSERFDVAQKLLSLLNSYTPKEVRQSCLGMPCFYWFLNSLSIYQIQQTLLISDVSAVSKHRCIFVLTVALWPIGYCIGLRIESSGFVCWPESLCHVLRRETLLYIASLHPAV